MRVTNATDKRKSNPVARKGKQKVFKQIEILGSDDDNSEDEEDYVPPKNYEKDFDDSEDDTSGSEEDEQRILDEIRNDVPEVSKLSRKRKARVSTGAYARKQIKKFDNRRIKSPQDRVLQFPNDCLSVVNGKLACRACCIFDLALKHSSIRSHCGTDIHKTNILKRDKNQLTLLSYGKIV